MAVYENFAGGNNSENIVDCPFTKFLGNSLAFRILGIMVVE